MKLILLVISLVFVLYQGYIVNVSVQGQTENERSITNSQNDFIQSIILILIPVIAVAVTSKWLTNSWQIRNEKVRIKREVLAEFEESSKRLVILMDTFVRFIVRQYSSYGGVQNKMENGNVELSIVFPNGPKDQPFLKFANEYEKHEQYCNETRFTSNRFLSSIRLYYRNKELETEINELDARISSAMVSIEQLVRSKNGQEFIGFYEAYTKKFNEIRELVKGFESKLVDAKLHKVTV